MDLKESELIGDQPERHWYYRAKLAALMRATDDVAPGPVIDVGAGAGFFSRALLESGRATQATCVDPGYAEDSDDSVGGRQLRFRRQLADEDGQAGLALMMDVLEHVEDDVGLARAYADRLPRGARVIVTVPAFKWLWSGHDVFLEHYRRYTLRQLEGVLRAAGLQVEVGCYFYGAVLPAAAAARLLGRLKGDRGAAPRSDMRPFGPALNSLFWNACRMELPLFRRNRVAGLSVFARAVKA